MHPIITAIATNETFSRMAKVAAAQLLPLLRDRLLEDPTLRDSVEGGARALLTVTRKAAPGWLPAAFAPFTWVAGGAFAAGVATGWLTAPRAGADTRRRLKARARLVRRSTRRTVRHGRERIVRWRSPHNPTTRSPSRGPVESEALAGCPELSH